MSDLIKSEVGTLAYLAGKKGKEVALPKPFERDIFLFETRIAGTSHIVGLEELLPHLHIGTKLLLFREPDNPHDGDAILVKTKNGVKLGYVPRKHNFVFVRLMDAGKQLFCKITVKEIEEGWARITINIFMHE